MRHQVIGTRQEPPGLGPNHARIVGLCTAEGPDDCRYWTLDALLAALDAGERFYTVDPASGAKANVHSAQCTTCGRRTVRSRSSTALKSPKTRLDSLPRTGNFHACVTSPCAVRRVAGMKPLPGAGDCRH